MLHCNTLPVIERDLQRHVNVSIHLCCNNVKLLRAGFWSVCCEWNIGKLAVGRQADTAYSELG